MCVFRYLREQRAAVNIFTTKQVQEPAKQMAQDLIDANEVMRQSGACSGLHAMTGGIRGANECCGSVLDRGARHDLVANEITKQVPAITPTAAFDAKYGERKGHLRKSDVDKYLKPVVVTLYKNADRRIACKLEDELQRQLQLEKLDIGCVQRTSMIGTALVLALAL